MKELLTSAFQAAVNAADPALVLAQFLPSIQTLSKYEKVIVVGAGKAGGSMAAALEKAYAVSQARAQEQGHKPLPALSGVVVTRYGHAAPTQWIKVVEAAHPVPDAACLEAAQAVLSTVRSASEKDLVIALISGGGSSLLSLPVEGVSLSDLQQLTSQLLASGAPIEQMNVVRKHLSQVQGGRLAQACSADMQVLVISDVAGDDLSAIASGPFYPDASSFADAVEILNRWHVTPAPAITAHLSAGVAGKVLETPKPGAALFAKVEHHLIATAHKSLEAAASVCKLAGFRPIILGDTVTGEARDVAAVMAALTREILRYNEPFAVPVALLSGGECTVTIKSDAKPSGRGGRCSEFLLALAAQLGEQTRVSAVAADTDGIDGSEDNAGAVLVDDSWARARAAGLNPMQFLDRHDGYGFFSAIGGLVHTGPTLTNVNDFRLILIQP